MKLSRVFVYLGIAVIVVGAALVFRQGREKPIEGTLFIDNENVASGYTLFSPLNGTGAYLINNQGEVINSWESEYFPGNSEYLMEDGTLYRGGKLTQDVITHGGASGIIEKYSWDGELLWDYEYLGDDFISHHDIEVLPNGNILIQGWERKTQKEALAVGMDKEYATEDGVTVDYLVELNPETKEIVWEWHIWDHLVQNRDKTKPGFGKIKDNPNRINVNYYDYSRPVDWTHANSVDYNEDLDQILLSVREFNEIWIIDHSTTTKEANGSTGGRYGMGGDLLYRWGNDFAYGQGTNDDRILYLQHDAEWVPNGHPGEGNITVYSNGQREDVREYSTVEEIKPPLTEDGFYEMDGDKFVPADRIWTYGDGEEETFFSFFISGSQRLPNGNTFITSGAEGRFIEVTSDKQIVWEYLNPLQDYSDYFEEDVRQVFRAYKYPEDFAGFDGRDLTSKGLLVDETPSEKSPESE
ncbi:MAG: aryl-sulfate sulfotransferase [Candidatus Dojkabacteria bacterium]